jgi:O-antigen/teichoic acid export membrane protein
MKNQDGIKKIIKIIFGVSIKIVSLLIGLYTMRWLNSNLNASELKSFFLTLFFTGSFLTISTLGLANILNRTILEKETQPLKFDKLWINSILIQTIISIFGIFVMYFVSLYNPVLPFGVLILVYIAQYFLAVDGSIKIITDFNNNTWTFTLTDLISKLLILFSLLFYSKYYIGSNNILVYGLIILFCAMFQFVLDVLIQRKNINWVKPDFGILLEYRSEIIQFTVITLALVFASNSDRWFLSYFKISDYAINGYVNAYNLYTIVTMLETFILPPLYFNMLKGKDNAKSINELVLNSKWFYIILGLSIFSAIGFKIASGLLLPIVNKNGDYLAYSYQVVDYLSILLLFNSSSNLLSHLLIFKNKVKQEFIAVVIFLISTVLLYILLIPQFGHVGAAIASVVGFVVNFVYKAIITARYSNETIYVN